MGTLFTQKLNQIQIKRHMPSDVKSVQCVECREKQQCEIPQHIPHIFKVLHVQSNVQSDKRFFCTSLND